MTKLSKIFKKGTAVLLCLMLLVPLAMAAFPAEALSYSGSSSYASGKYYTALTNVNLTGNMRTDIVNIAKSQNGYLEGNSNSELSGETTTGSNNYTEYGRWYGLQDMWCAMFVSWCAHNAGVSTSVIPKTASTVTALNYFINQGVAHTRASISAGNYTPIAGDIIFFKSSRNTAITNHIGIVTSFSGTTINTIEGNTSSATVSTNGGCVRAKSYSITNTYIVYVCRPNYPSDANSSDMVEFDKGLYDYRYWPNNDSRWGNKTIGSGSATVGTSSGITTAVTKLAIQSELHTANGFPVDNFVDIMNAAGGYTAAGAMYWDKAKTAAGFDSVEPNLMSESTEGIAFTSETYTNTTRQQLINWLLDGYHLALYVADSSGAKTWVAVDEARSISTGHIFIMDGSDDVVTNANITVQSKFASLRRVAGFTGGTTQDDIIGSDDYRVWRKRDNRWQDIALGDTTVWAANDGGKGELIIASTKLAIQAGLKNPEVYDVRNAIADTKLGSNGGFSSAGNMYWADAAQALGFESYNANLLASGSYTVTAKADELKTYISQGKHLLVLVNGTWVAVDEAKTQRTGTIWVWRSNIEAYTGGEKVQDNACTLASIDSGNFSRVACFTGGKIKTNEDQYVCLSTALNDWATNRTMTRKSDGTYEKTIYVSSNVGVKGFKIIANGVWFGRFENNEGHDIDVPTASPGWEFHGEDYGGTSNCYINFQQGYYTFNFKPEGYADHPYHVMVTYSATPPVLAEAAPIVDSGADDYRKWNITDERWGSVTLGTSGAKTLSAADVNYGDLYVAGAKLLIQSGIYTPENMNPGTLAEAIRSSTTDGQFQWDGFAGISSSLSKVNTSLIPNGTYETRLGGKTAENNNSKTLKQYILENHYHLFIKIDDFSGGYGWALVDEAMTASATGGEIYVWLSKSTSSKSTDDNPVLLSSISTTFKRVAAYSGGNNIVQTTFSGNNGAETAASYTYEGMDAEINSGNYVPYGAAVTVTGTPAAGYEFDEWTHNLGTGDAAPTTNSTTLKYTAYSAATITYSTKSQNGTINYSDENHFTYAAGKPTSAAANTNVSFTITPDTDYLATVFVEDSNGSPVSVSKSTNTYSFTMPAGDVNVSVEMNYDDYRKWSKSDSRWAETTLGSSSNKVKGTTVGMGDLVVAVTKLSKQAGASVADVNAAVTKLNSGGGLGGTGYLDWAGTVNSNLGLTAYHLYNTSGSSTGDAAAIVNGIKNDHKHYVIKVNNSIGWVAVDETLTLLTGEIYVMRSGDNADENADVRLADLSSTFANYAHFTGGSTPSPTKRTITFSGSSHIGITASYTIGSNSYSISSGDQVNDGMTVRFRASAEPSYEFGDWSCTGVTPDQEDASELVVTATANVTVGCTEKAKDTADTNVKLRVKYAYKEYDPSISDTYEYKEGNDYLVDKTVFSNEFTVTADTLDNATTLRAKVSEGAPRLENDYFNYRINLSGYTDAQLKDAIEYDYTVDAYVLPINMTNNVRTYAVQVNSTNADGPYHFQQKVTLNASTFNVTDAVWEDGGNILCIGNEFEFRVTGDMNLTVREKTGSDPESLDGRSVITYAYKTLTSAEGVEKCNQNFYIRNYIDVNDSSKTFIGAGVFYYLYDDTNNKPVKSAVTNTGALTHLEDYALGLANKSTAQVTKHTYNGKETGLSYSYINYEEDSAKNENERILRSPGGDCGYVNYIYESSINNQPANANRYSYRVYSFYLYSAGGTTHAVVTNNLAAAKVFSASE